MGFESEIPEDVVHKPMWIKSLSSPVWIGKNRGNKDKKPGYPYPDEKRFSKWLARIAGKPSKDTKVILCGLTLDRCILSSAQEIDFRGYDVYILSEGTDMFSGNPEEKEYMLNNVPIKNWANPLSWSELQTLYQG